MKFVLRLLTVLLIASGFVFAQQPINETQVGGAAIATGNGVATGGSQRVTIASDNTAFAVLATLSAETTKVIGTVRLLGNIGAVMDFVGQNAAQPPNSLLIGGEFNTTPTTITNGNASPLQLDSAASLKVNCITGCGAGGTTSLVPVTTGGATMSHLVAAASTNATSLKATAGQVYGASVYNNATYPVYLKFYNKASAPTVGTDPVVYAVAVQAGTEREVHTEQGLAFSTGIAYAVTKGITDADATALLVSDAIIDMWYK